MKDSVERIFNKGNSSLLFKLAERVVNPDAASDSDSSDSSDSPSVCESVSSSSSDNVMVISPIKRVNDSSILVGNKADFAKMDAKTEKVVVKKCSCNDPDFTELRMDVCAALKLLVIDEKSLQYVSNLVIRGLSQLEEVSIGSKCFTETEGGRVEVSECNALKRVSIGDECCSEWSEFVLRNCSMEEVSIGDGCFVYFQNTVFEGECCEWE